MKCVVKISTVALLTFATASNAGFNAVTAHSRANCAGFNESITWYFKHVYNWRVESHHYINKSAPGPQHIINTGLMYTWRAAAYHATEAYSTRGDAWYVNGYHFYYPNGKERLDVITGAFDCNIYDGWWDQ